jgi:hypothetical protein
MSIEQDSYMNDSSKGSSQPQYKDEEMSICNSSNTNKTMPAAYLGEVSDFTNEA